MRPRHILPLLVLLFAWSTPLGAVEVISASSQSLRLDVNTGVLIRLDRDARTIFIANPKIADIEVKSPRLVYLTGKSVGETTLYALDKGERVIISRRVQIRHNLTRLSSALRSLLPDSDLNVQSVDGALVLSGSVGSASEALDAKRLAEKFGGKNLVDRISVTEPNQVQLRVKIAEVDRTVLKRFGVNLAAGLRLPNGTVSLFSGEAFIEEPFAFFQNKAFDAVRGDTNTALYTFNNGNVDINSLLDLLESEGLVTILAEPNLVAVSGESASFLAGGQFPIVTQDGDGNTSVSFKNFGVELGFTPSVLNGNRINLKVKPTVSQISATAAVQIDGFFIPGLNTRQTETTVEMASGQSFAIAGLLQNNMTRSIEKLPGLADVPILGPLFRSDRFDRQETELVIIVTPYIVRPTSGRLAAPTDGLQPPTDTDRILRGRLYRPSTSRGRSEPAVRGRGPVGATGFMLD